MYLNSSLLKHSLPTLIMLLCSSCAAIFNSKKTTTTIHTYPDHAQIILNQKDTFCCNVELVSVLRSGYPLEIKVKKDSLQKTVFVKPLLSTIYVAPNVFFGWVYGGGYLLDLISRKRFTYPNDIYINVTEKGDKYKTGADNQLVNICLQLPLINVYNHTVGRQSVSSTGTLGFVGSMEYYLDKDYYLSGSMGYYPKFGGFLYSSPNREYRYMSLSANKRMNRWHLGVGLAWVRFNYENDYFGENSEPDGYVYTHGYALKLGAEYQLSNEWYLGAAYQPMVYKDKGNDGNNANFFGIQLNYKISLATANRAFSLSH